MALTFIDFFAGIGGFRRGMELAGHKCVGHCEIDKYADASYRSMHTITDEQREYLATLPLKQRQKEILKGEYLNGEWFANDITRVLPESLPSADVYCFGFPCQSFSIAGQRRGFEDTRGTLFFEILRLAKERQPRMLFGENVAGLLNHDRGRTFATLLNAMEDVGFDAEWQVLNSRYFGVPQNRPRVFIVGHNRGGVADKYFLSSKSVQRLLSYKDTRIHANQDDVVSNAITAGKRDQVGIYPIGGGGYRESERIPQVLITGIGKPNKVRGCANTLIANYPKIGKFERTYVIEDD